MGSRSVLYAALLYPPARFDNPLRGVNDDRERPPFALAFATMMVMAFVATAVAADSNIGTWKLNVAKSKFSPGPAPKSQTLKIEAGASMESPTPRMASTQTANPPIGRFRAKDHGEPSGSPAMRTRTCCRTSGLTPTPSNRRRR